MEKEQIDYMQEEKERTVTAIELVKAILRKWWVVVLLAVLFAALLGGYKYARDSRASSVGQNAAQIQSMEDALSDEEIAAVSNALLAENHLADLKNYLQNSTLMQIDPNGKDMVSLQYRVEIPEGEETDSYATDLAHAYEGYVDDGALTSDLVQNGYEMEEQYLGELFQYVGKETTVNDTTSYTIDVSYDSNVFSVQVCHADRESAEELADQVEDAIASYQSMLASSIGEHSLVLLNRSYSQIVDKSLWMLRDTLMTSLISWQDSVEELENGLSDDQGLLLSQYQAQQEALEAAEEGETTETTNTVHISRRYVAIGALAGIVIACLLIIAVYVLRGSIRSAAEIRRLYQLRILGEVNCSGKGKRRVGQDRRKSHLPLEEQERLALLNLRAACMEHDVKTMLCSGSCELDAENEMAAYLSSELAKDKISVVTVANPAYSAEALEALQNADAVVLLEKVNASRYDEIDELVRTCREHGSLILGTIMVS